MNVTIFETGHIEAVYPVIQLFNCNHNSITVFCYAGTDVALQQLLGTAAGKIKWIVKKETQSPRNFIFTMYRHLQKNPADILYLNTVTDNFIFYALLVKWGAAARKIVTLHHLNLYRHTKKKYLLRRWVRHIGKKLLISYTSELNVLSGTLLPLAHKLFPGKTIHNIPGVIFEGNAPTVNFETPIKLVVPGAIEAKRRNYLQVIELAEAAGKNGIPLHITLCGPVKDAYSAAIITACKKLQSSLVRFSFFETATLIPQETFDATIANSHFIFSPLVATAITDDDVEEQYGVSIASGNISDAVKHARPLIVPAALLLDPPMQTAAIRYNTIHDIVQLLQSLYQQRLLYNKLQQKSLTAAQQYTVATIRDLNKDFFCSD